MVGAGGWGAGGGGGGVTSDKMMSPDFMHQNFPWIITSHGFPESSVVFAN